MTPETEGRDVTCVVSSLTQVSGLWSVIAHSFSRTHPTPTPLPSPLHPLTPSQIMLDPTLRTIAGLEALIQKEWVAMGHPFASRHKMVSAPSSKDELEGFVSGVLYWTEL